MYRKKIELYQNISDKNIFYAIDSLFATFHQANAELYLVGGCVRDLLLYRNPKDFDMCTNLTPDQVKKLLTEVNNKEEYETPPYSFIDTGLKHGTITIHDKWHNQFFEITTYRIDGKYEDNRHPKEVTFTPSLEEDLKRRDFTINSFAYDFYNQELIMLSHHED